MPPPTTPIGLPRGWYDITDWGCVGDGVTDCTPYFNNAVQYVASLGPGGIVYGPSGAYKMAGSAVNVTGISIRGAGEVFGEKGTRFLPLDSAHDILDVSGSSVGIYDIQFGVNGSLARCGVFGMQTTQNSGGFTNLRMERCCSEGAFNVASVYFDNLTDNVMRDCQWRNTSSGASPTVLLSRDNWLNVPGWYIQTLYGSPWLAGPHDNAGNTVIDHCEIQNPPSNGIQNAGPAIGISGAGSITITGNSIVSSASASQAILLRVSQDGKNAACRLELDKMSFSCQSGTPPPYCIYSPDAGAPNVVSCGQRLQPGGPGWQNTPAAGGVQMLYAGASGW